MPSAPLRSPGRGPTPPDQRSIHPPSPGVAARLGPPVAVAAAGVIAFHGALRYYFGQDDFSGLARAAGLLPRLNGPWRLVSGQLYFDLLRRIAGLDAAAYHLASLLAHAGCAALLYALLARRLSRPAALAGAAFFATHPALFTALYSVSGIGEILALLFGLGVLWLAPDRSGARWLAIPLFALSLLSKESTLLLPLAMAAGFATGPADRARVRRLAGALGLLALAYAAVYLGSDVFGVRAGLPGNAPYALAGAAGIWNNLLTYLGWILDATVFTGHDLAETVQPAVFPWGMALLALWLAGLLWGALRARGWAAAGAALLLFLLPVLPLRNHTYHYYLYAPLAGAAWCVAAAFDAFASARSGWRTALAAATIVAALLTVNGLLLARRLENAPFLYSDMRAHPVVDRARVAGNVAHGLRGAALPPGTRLWFWSPALQGAARDPARLREERAWESNLRAALMDGLGVRVLFPNVADVGFLERYRPLPASDRVAVYRRDGRLQVATPAEVEALLREHPMP